MKVSVKTDTTDLKSPQIFNQFEKMNKLTGSIKGFMMKIIKFLSNNFNTIMSLRMFLHFNNRFFIRT